MANMRLGPSGSETILPKLEWMEGRPSLPVSTYKQVTEARMSDGSIRPAFYQVKREFRLEWGFLTLKDLDIIRDLHALNQVLRFQDLNKDDIWYNVIFISFVDEPARTDIRSLGRFRCEIILREI